MSKELDLIERLDALVPSLGSKIATGVTVAGGATASGGQWLLSSDHVACCLLYTSDAADE